MQNPTDSKVLVDIRDVRVDRTLPQDKRFIEYVRQIKTPNHFMCLDWEVTTIHPDDGPPFEDCLQRIMA